MGQRSNELIKDGAKNSKHPETKPSKGVFKREPAAATQLNNQKQKNC